MPDAVEVSTAPLFSVMLLPPLVLMFMAPLVTVLSSVSDCASLKVSAASVEVLHSQPTALLPVRLMVPPPPAAISAAVSVPRPDRLAPLATDIVAVPDPTFHEPVSDTVPAETVVAPV